MQKITLNLTEEEHILFKGLIETGLRAIMKDEIRIAEHYCKFYNKIERKIK